MTFNASLARKLITLLQKGIVILFLTSMVMVLALRWVDPPLTAFMIRYRLSASWHRQKSNTIQHYWVKLDQISPCAELAVITSEDQKFYMHQGFDFESITDAWQRRNHSTRLRGGSTITQQAAKNLFLWPGKSYFRKGLEAYFTLLIEAFWPKQRILEVYLNIAEFGDGIFGIEAASKKFFKHPAKQLTLSECALLAAVLPNPVRFKVNRPSSYIWKRYNLILKKMYQSEGPKQQESNVNDN
jgi:monofunctional biosynthetic peptidoglycan transglycosylase